MSMSGHANCIPAPTPPASCTFTCLKGRWMRVTAVCAQQKPQHLNNLNHAAPKGTFVNVQADRCRQQQLLRRFTATVHKRITSCIRVRVDTSLRSAPKHAVHMPLAMPVYTHIYIYIYLYIHNYHKLCDCRFVATPQLIASSRSWRQRAALPWIADAPGYLPGFLQCH